jgi:hypothetical protein
MMKPGLRDLRAARLLIEACERRRLLATWTVPGLTTGSDTVTLNRTGAGTYRAVVNGTTYNGSSVTAVLLNASSGDDFIRLDSADVPVTVNGGAGFDMFDIGLTAQDYRAVTGAVTFNGDVDQDYVGVHGEAITTPIVASFSGNTLTATGFGGLTYSSDTVEVRSGSGADTINFNSTAATFTASAFTGAGDDVVQIAPTGKSLSAFTYSIFVEAGSHASGDRIYLHDESFTGTRTMSFTGRFFRIGSFSIGVENFEFIDVLGSPGNDTFDCTLSDAFAATVSISGNNGNDTVLLAVLNRVTSGGFAFAPGSGNDLITIDESVQPSGYVNYSSSVPAAGAWALQRQGGTTSGITLAGGDASDQVRLTAPPQGAALRMEHNPSSPLTFQGGSGADVLYVWRRDTLAQPISFLGAGGSNTLTMATRKSGSTAACVVGATGATFAGAGAISYADVGTINVDAVSLQVDSLAATQTLKIASSFLLQASLAPAGRNLSAILGVVDLVYVSPALTETTPLQVYLDDSARSGGYAYSIGAAYQPGLAIPGGGSVRWPGGRIGLVSGAGNDTITLHSSIYGEEFALQTGDGNDLVRQIDAPQFAGGERIAYRYHRGLTLAGGAGDDVFWLDDAASVLDPSYTLQPSATVPTDAVVLRSQFDGTGSSVGPPRVDLPIEFVLQSPGTGDRIEIGTDAGGGDVRIEYPPVAVSVSGAAGIDRLTVGDATSPVTLNGGANADVFDVRRGSVPVTVIGGAGDDVVTVVPQTGQTASVRFPSNDDLASITLGAGATATLAPGGTVVLRTASISLSGNAAIDLADNALIVDYPAPPAGATPLVTIAAALATGRAGGAWNGPGIRSSVAAVVPGRSLGLVESAEAFSAFPASFAGQQVDASAVLVRYTLAGDANIDRRVDFDDLLRLAANYNTSGMPYPGRGDFNFSGKVDFDDLLALAANYNASQQATLPLLASSEPPAPPLWGSGPSSDPDRAPPEVLA